MLDILAPAARRTVVLVNEQQIDVGGEIKFATAELAHGQHQQAQGRAVLAIGAAEARFERTLYPGHGVTHHHIGERAEFGHDGIDIGAEFEIAPCDAHHLGTT